MRRKPVIPCNGAKTLINAFPRLRFTDSIKYSKIIETLHEMLRRK